LFCPAADIFKLHEQGTGPACVVKLPVHIPESFTRRGFAPSVVTFAAVAVMLPAPGTNTPPGKIQAAAVHDIAPIKTSAPEAESRGAFCSITENAENAPGMAAVFGVIVTT